MSGKLEIVVLVAVLLSSSSATLNFASYYGDHMVLQKAPRRSVVWGYAGTVGDSVTVTLSGHQPIETRVYRSPGGFAAWKVLLEPEPGPGPFSITATSTDGTASITDVLFGDVWLCSGQSNMQFTLDMVMNASQELVDSYHYPNIRVFTTSEKTSSKPEHDLLGILEHWSVPRNETVNGGTWKYFSAVCWLYGKYLYQRLRYPIGLIASSWGGTRIEPWSSPDALRQCNGDLTKTGLQNEAHETGELLPSEGSVLWNAMIHPFINLTMYGAIWYQGEANTGAPDGYKCRFPAMIDDWRTKFNEGSDGQTDKMFPFGFVQLAPYRDNSSYIGGWPPLRWHQTYDVGYVPNYRMQKVFMAVAIDLPDFLSPYGSVHPRYKQEVAARLVLSALPVAYNIHDMGRFQGPMITAYFIDIGYFTLGLEFDNGTSELSVRSKDGFEVCCSVNNQSKCDGSDSIWMDAPIISGEDHKVTLSYKGACSNKWVMGLRYLWRESPCPLNQCAVYSKENNLPVAPFLTLGLIGGHPGTNKVKGRQTGTHIRFRVKFYK